MTMRRPPSGLGADGLAMWRATMRAYVLDPIEVAMLAEACRVSDRLALIGAQLAAEPLTAAGSMGQPVANPLLRAAGELAGTLARLSAVLALPARPVVLPDEVDLRRRRRA